jgi:hypothetical protein
VTAWDKDGFCRGCQCHRDAGCECGSGPDTDTDGTGALEVPAPREPAEDRPGGLGRDGNGHPDAAAIRSRSGLAVARSLSEINEQFWSWPGRYGLGVIFDFARARRVSPWALLAEILLRVLVRTPPGVQLPPLVGANASLNLFAAIVGPSGQGKGQSSAAARGVIDLGWQIEGKGIGSGEGLVKLFGQSDKDGILTRTSYAELVSIHEIDSFGAQAQRSGATIAAELRKAYSGESLGFAYADNTKRVLLPAHSYRLCLSAGVQPGRGSVLLDDVDAGTPQRFIWLPASDPDAPDCKPNEPVPLQWELEPELARVKMENFAMPFVMDVCEAAKDLIDLARLARLRGEGNALDGHALLTRLKAAAALGIFDGRSNVTDDDWSLSGILMEVSDLTRESVLAQLRKASAEQNVAQAYAEASRATIIAGATDLEARSQTEQNITRNLIKSGGSMARNDLRRCLNSRLRGYFDEAIISMEEKGEIESSEIGTDRSGPGQGYRLRP